MEVVVMVLVLMIYVEPLMVHGLDAFAGGRW